MKRAAGWLVTAGLVGMALAINGCAVLVGGTAATVAYTAAQERSVGAAVDDATIQVQVSSNLLQKDVDLFRNVNTEVVEGRVLLTGSVPKPEDRIEAARLAWQVNGVKEVLNELQVEDSSGIGDGLKDRWITTQLRAKMLGDSKVHSINYSIDTVNGTIYLMGIAQSEDELARVTNYARNIRGVREVISHVRLTDDPQRAS